MQETNKARQAFEDYFQLGPSRSLRKLYRIYNENGTESPPTKHIATIGKWSTEHGWQNRIAEREAEIAAAALEELKETAKQTGYALVYKRITDLNVLAEKLFVDLDASRKPAAYLSAIREFRALLADIAAEMGERIKPLEIEHAGEVALTLKVQYGDPDARTDGQTKEPPLLAAPDPEQSS